MGHATTWVHTKRTTILSPISFMFMRQPMRHRSNTHINRITHHQVPAVAEVPAEAAASTDNKKNPLFRLPNSDSHTHFAQLHGTMFASLFDQPSVHSILTFTPLQSCFDLQGHVPEIYSRQRARSSRVTPAAPHSEQGPPSGQQLIHIDSQQQLMSSNRPRLLLKEQRSSSLSQP